MTDKKFTDEQIIKALECCIEGASCIKCPYFALAYGCIKAVFTDALSLIKRKKAEIERLEAINIGIQDEYTEIIFKKDKEIKTARAEAIKEFAERLKKRYVVDTDSGLYGILDQIAKEMTEGQT